MTRKNVTRLARFSPLREAETASGVQRPSPEELATIEAEWPLIAAEVELTDAEIRVVSAAPYPCELDWHRVRQARLRVAHEALAFAASVAKRGSLGRAA
jgi:hypothetical protein